MGGNELQRPNVNITSHSFFCLRLPWGNYKLSYESYLFLGITLFVCCHYLFYFIFFYLFFFLSLLEGEGGWEEEEGGIWSDFSFSLFLFLNFLLILMWWHVSRRVLFFPFLFPPNFIFLSPSYFSSYNYKFQLPM